MTVLGHGVGGYGSRRQWHNFSGHQKRQRANSTEFMGNSSSEVRFGIRLENTDAQLLHAQGQV